MQDLFRGTRLGYCKTTFAKIQVLVAAILDSQAIRTQHVDELVNTTAVQCLEIYKNEPWDEKLEGEFLVPLVLVPCPPVVCRPSAVVVRLASVFVACFAQTLL